jgi:hypothetical protein
VLKLRVRLALPALLLAATAAQAEPAPPASGAFRGRSADAPRPSGSDGVRRVFPGQPGDLIDRLRNRVKLPSDGPRARGRQARARERAFEQLLKNPDADPEEVRAKLKEMQEHQPELRRERRRALFARWGKTTADPRAKAELELHARRMARIRRMQVLASTERSGEKRTALLERLSRLRDLERGRHDRAMQAIAAGKEPEAGPIVSPSARPVFPNPSALREKFGKAPARGAKESAK